MSRVRRITSAGVLLAVLFALTGLTACRTARQIGVRPGFRRAQVERVLMHPVYFSGFMGLDAAQREALRARYEASIERWFADRQIAILSSQALTQHITERGAWQAYRDGLELRHPLFDYFQDEDDHQRAVEIIALRNLSRAGHLPDGTLLFVEIVYHGDAPSCAVRAADYNPRTLTLRESEGLPSDAACVVSHLRGKLVEPPSARTMWANERLVELRAVGVNEARVEATMLRAVGELLGGDKGLLRLLYMPQDR